MKQDHKHPSPRGPSPYEVGYCKPPAQTRSKPGQSGNPSGKRKPRKDTRTVFSDVLATPITITEGGVTRTIDQRQALYKSMVLKAAKGDTRAQALTVKLMDQYGILRTERDKHPPYRIEIIKLSPQKLVRLAKSSQQARVAC